jgi:hypothetical protein
MIKGRSYTIDVEDDLSAVSRAQEELDSLWTQYSLPEESRFFTCAGVSIWRLRLLSKVASNF